MGMFGICGNHDEPEDDRGIHSMSRKYDDEPNDFEGFGWLHEHSEMCEHEEDE